MRPVPVRTRRTTVPVAAEGAAPAVAPPLLTVLTPRPTIAVPEAARPHLITIITITISGPREKPLSTVQCSEIVTLK